MIDNIFKKYQVPANYPREPLSTLYFILRKAELAKNLSNNERDWLASQNLADTISLINTQQENRAKIAETIQNDLASLHHDRFVRSQLLSTPSPESERALVFFKVHNLKDLAEKELALIDRGYKYFLSVTKFKEKTGITEDIPFDQNAVQRLTKITSGRLLSAGDYPFCK